MKTTIKITIMLMSMTIGTLAASAQSAQRERSRATNQNRTEVSSKARVQERSRPTAQKTESRSVSSRTNTQRTQVRTEKPETRSGRNVSTRVTPAPKRTTSVQHNSPKISTTRNENPRSNYHKPAENTKSGKTFLDPKSGSGYSNNNTGSRNTNSTVHHSDKISHYHGNKYYPQRRVNIHVHPVTYRNHYKVLYYPAHRDIIWTRRLHNYYVGIYPGFTWHYPLGYHVRTISVFDARYNIGEVSRIYGRVYATWFNRETDDLLLFFGGEYPNQEFTMVVPGDIARRFSWFPEHYFLGRHVLATGLITSFEGHPEMVIKRKTQVDIY